MSDSEELENAAIELLLKSSLMMLLSAEDNDQKEKYSSDDAKRACVTSTMQTPRPKPRKRLWMEKWREEKQSRRSFLSPYARLSHLQSCSKYIRMDEDSFNEILFYIADDIRKKGTVMRSPVPPDQKLSTALRFLATGESFNTLNFETGYSNKFLSESVMEVCKAICNKMQKSYLQFPETKQNWLQIANKFSTRWEFPHCIGALDSKHIQFIAPKRERDSLFIEKAFNSVTLLALTDSDCKFIFVDIGRHGPIKDAEILERSPLVHITRQSQEHLPSDEILGNNRFLPYVIIADDAFPLEKHLMKPYSGSSDNPLSQIFNARLSNARQCAERAFGILCNSFRVLQTKIYLNHRKVKRLILCCCILHNFLMEKSTWYREQVLSRDEKNAMALLEVSSSKELPESTMYGEIAEPIRDSFAEYFFNEGCVPWQQNYVELKEVTKYVP